MEASHELRPKEGHGNGEDCSLPMRHGVCGLWCLREPFFGSTQGWCPFSGLVEGRPSLCSGPDRYCGLPLSFEALVKAVASAIEDAPRVEAPAAFGRALMPKAVRRPCSSAALRQAMQKTRLAGSVAFCQGNVKAQLPILLASDLLFQTPGAKANGQRRTAHLTAQFPDAQAGAQWLSARLVPAMPGGSSVRSPHLTHLGASQNENRFPFGSTHLLRPSVAARMVVCEVVAAAACAGSHRYHCGGITPIIGSASCQVLGECLKKQAMLRE